MSSPSSGLRGANSKKEAPHPGNASHPPASTPHEANRLVVALARRDARLEVAPFALFAFSAVGLAGLTWLIESLAHGQSSGRWLLPALPIVTIFFFASLSSIWRAREAAVARELSARVAPTERPLAYCRMPGHRFVLATHQRVLAVNLQSALHSSREQWSMPYAQITAIQPRNKKLGVPMIVRTNRDFQQIAVRELLATEQDSFDYQRYHHEALLLILSRRTRSEPAIAPDRAS